MSVKTKIEWTDATWNPVTGCNKVSEGCRNCYALTFAERWRGTPGHYFENGFDLTLRPHKLDEPLRWTKPRKIFVNSMSDLFHEDIPDSFIDEVFAIMAVTPHHTYQILTKRPKRMLEWFTPNRSMFVAGAAQDMGHKWKLPDIPMDDWWPLKNVWLGTSVENQQAADERIPLLLGTPAAVRFLSCEPLLGPVKILGELMQGKDPGKCGNCGGGHGFTRCSNYGGVSKSSERYECHDFKRVDFAIDWVIVGGESGHKARPMHPDWARSLRDQCQAAGVPFFFKQWGEWMPLEGCWEGNQQRVLINSEGTSIEPYNKWGLDIEQNWCKMIRVGKKVSGRLLDGREWNEYPGSEE